MKSMNLRQMFLYIYRAKKTNLIGVEIGAEFGRNAYHIMEKMHHNILKLYLIDPYLKYDGYIDSLDFPNTQEYFDDMKKKSHKLLKYWIKKGKITFIQKLSADAVKDFNDKTLDFVYIDGNHSYQYVKQDIQLWYSKVKPNGIIGGHDFKAGELGVVEAVTEFAKEKNYQLNGSDHDWWIIKRDE